MRGVWHAVKLKYDDLSFFRAIHDLFKVCEIPRWIRITRSGYQQGMMHQQMNGGPG
ncbi:MAG: hypothetical protein R3C61_24305 [Bacteroidia bacterium]